MIELIYNEEEKYTTGEKTLPNPKNVKQIGEPREYKKIFIEDSVHTFLCQYGKGEETKAKIAILFGKAERSGGVRHLYIKGALPIEHAAEKQGRYIISEKLWGEIYEQKEIYFPEQEIMGWFLAKPGFAVEKTTVIEETHRTYFSGADKVLFMTEPIEGESSFLGFDGNRFTKQPGFYIYYDKNEPMQTFLEQKEKQKSHVPPREKMDVAVANFRSILKEKQKKKAKHKKMVISYGMKVSIALVLFVGAVTLKNQTEKIRMMEEQMSQLVSTEPEEKAQVLSDDVVVEELPGNVEAQENVIPEQMLVEEPEPELPVTEDENKAASEPAEKEQPEEPVQEEKQPETYTVQAGDSLAKISRERYGSDNMVDEICALNEINNGDYIQVGETILLP